jgi:hypothetical protein
MKHFFETFMKHHETLTFLNETFCFTDVSYLKFVSY